MVKQRTREQWDQRAREDLLFYLFNPHGRHSQDLESFYRAGKEQGAALARLALARLNVDPVGKTVLDIGCGIGRLFPGFADLGFAQVWGIDVSPEMVARGRLLCPVPSARFVLGNGVDLSALPSAYFDFCISYNTFMALDRATFWRYLREVCRVLRPGGAMQLHFRGRDVLKRRLLRLAPRPVRPAAHVLFRLLTLPWARGRPLRASALERLSWEGDAVPPQRVRRAAERLGLLDVAVLPDPTYRDGTMCYVVGRKPASSPGA